MSNKPLIIAIFQIRAITFLLGVCGISLSIGFVFMNTSNPNYTALLQLANYAAWSLGFFTYGCIKVFQALFRVPYYIKLINAAQGMWLWTYLLLSFVVFDFSPLAPTELLLFVPVLCEVWEVTINIVNTKIHPDRRETDTKC